MATDLGSHDGPGEVSQGRSRGARVPSWLVTGGTEGNERLTVVTGALLLVLLAAVGVTIVFIGRLLWWHLFLGLVLIGPVALKLASTGYRFVRYYTAEPRYRGKGPPAPVLRMLGPVVVSLTVIVFGTGVALLLTGPSGRGPLVLVHKVSFICWAVVTGVHIVAHLPELVRFRAVSRRARTELNALRSMVPGLGGAAPPPAHGAVPGSAARWLSVATAIVLGLVLAAVFVPDFRAWTGSQTSSHHAHHLR